mmetsp:Transcript_186/g.546  ORF Transcript_186/g.546 Transcript_186/m.546 type:complete len:261 (+) Transcript_186:10-792(+)
MFNSRCAASMAQRACTQACSTQSDSSPSLKAPPGPNTDPTMTAATSSSARSGTGSVTDANPWPHAASSLGPQNRHHRAHPPLLGESPRAPPPRPPSVPRAALWRGWASVQRPTPQFWGMPSASGPVGISALRSAGSRPNGETKAPATLAGSLGAPAPWRLPASGRITRSACATSARGFPLSRAATARAAGEVSSAAIRARASPSFVASPGTKPVLAISDAASLAVLSAERRCRRAGSTGAGRAVSVATAALAAVGPAPCP